MGGLGQPVVSPAVALMGDLEAQGQGEGGGVYHLKFLVSQRPHILAHGKRVALVSFRCDMHLLPRLVWSPQLWT